MSNIIVVAKMKVKKEFANEVYNELLTLYKNTHALDEGVLQYDLHKDISNENSYVFVETWSNLSALNKHEEKAHFLASIKNLADKLESIDINRLEKLDI